jgi:metal-responsive CopG/Arc/MetJ family transcriptional regulator
MREKSNTKFDVRTTTEVLQKLDEALEILNYSDRSDWFRAMFRETVEKAENKKGGR